MLKKMIREDAPAVLAGSALFGLSLALFLTPCDIVMGGASGVAITLRHFLPLPVGVWILLLNLPLLAIAVRVVGLQGMARTIAGVLTTSAATDLFSFLPAATEDPLLAAAFGGALLGAGGGLLLPRGYTTGGSDLAAYLWHKKDPRRKVGTLILMIDAVIVAGSALLLQNFAGVIHSAVSIVSFSVAMDAVMRSLGRAKLSLIVSDRYAEIGDAITKNISRGATVLRGLGWYTKNERNVVMCVVKRSELYALKSLVKSIDGNAFLIVTDASEVLGYGFEPPQ